MLRLSILLTADGKIAQSEIQRVTGDLQRMGQAGRGSGGDASAGLGQAREAARGFGAETQSLIGQVGALRASIAGLAAAFALREVVEAGLTLQRVNNTLLAVSGSTTGAARDLAFIRNEAQRLGLDMSQAAQTFAAFAAAARGTSLQGQGAQAVFRSVAEAVTVLGLSSADTEGAFRALQQMMSKGTVQMEELRGQLGDRLPGALDAAARAMGKTTAEFIQMVENGQVAAEDFLPRFAAELSRTFGAGLPAAVTSAQASINRFKNAVFDAMNTLNQGGFMAAFQTAVDALTRSLGSGGALTTGLQALGAATAAVASNFGLLTGAAAGYIALQIATSIQAQVAGLIQQAQTASAARAATLALAQAEAAAAAERLKGLQATQAAIAADRTLIAQRLAAGAQSARGGLYSLPAADDLVAIGQRQASVNAALPAATAAATRTAEAAAAAERANSAFGKLLAAGGAVVSFFGGPWVLALVAAGAAIGFLLTRETEADRQQQQLTQTIERITAARRAETTATRDQAAAAEAGTRAIVAQARAAAEARLEAARAAAATAAAGVEGAQRLAGPDPLAANFAAGQTDNARSAVMSALAALQEVRAAAGEFDAQIQEEIRAFSLFQNGLSAAAIGRAELAIRKFREEIDPSIKATRELAQAESDLNTVVAGGRMTREAANAVLDQARRHYQDVLNPIGAYIQRLQEEAQVLSQVGLARDQAAARIEFARGQKRPATPEETRQINENVQRRNEQQQFQDNEELRIRGLFANERRDAGSGRSAQARVDAREAAYRAIYRTQGQSAADAFQRQRLPPAADTQARITYDRTLGIGTADAGRESAQWVRETQAAIDANNRLAEAQTRGAAAIRQAEVANRAEQEALRGNSDARGRVIQLLTDEEQSRHDLAVATAAADLDRETEGLARIAAAEQQGAAAVREANIQNRIAAQLFQLRIEAGTDEAALIERKIRAQERYNQDIANSQVLRSRREELETAQLELSLAGETEEARNRILEVFRTELDLRRRGIDLTSAQARQELALADQIGRTRGALAEANRAREAWIEPFKNAIQGIQSAFSDAFQKILSGGVKTFGDLRDAVWQVMYRLAAEIAALLVFRPIVGGVLNLAGLGSLAQQLGVGGGSGGSGGGSGGTGLSGAGGLSLLNDLGRFATSGNIGTLTPGLDAWAQSTFGFGQIGGSTGGQIGIGGMIPGGQFGGGGGLFSGSGGTFAGFSSLGNILGIAGAAIPGLISGNYAQAGFGAGGAALGTLILPGIGTAVGGFLGNLIGGLFGKKKIVVPAGAGWFDTAGAVSDLWSTTGDTGRVTGLGGPYAEALKQIVTAAGGTSITAGNRVNIGYDGGSYWVRYAQGGANEFHGENAQQLALQNALNAVAPSLQIEGIGRAAQSVLQNKGATDTLDQLVQDLQTAVQWQKAYDDALANAGKSMSQAEQQLKALNDQFDAMVSQGATYGYSSSEIAAVFSKNFNASVAQQIQQITNPQQAALDALESEHQAAVAYARKVGADVNQVEKLYGLKRIQIVEATAKDMNNVLQQWLDNQKLTPTSSLSPEQRLAEAQSQFDAIISQVKGGQAGVGAALDAADKLLAEARSFYASGEGFGAIERTIRETLMGVGHQLGIPGFAAGGYPPTGTDVLVGERGPERVRFLSPARVYSADETRQMARRERETLTPTLSAWPGGVDATARVFAEWGRRMLDVLRSIDARLANLERGGNLAASRPT